MNWSDIGKLIGTAAPIVGTAIGGPAGAAIGSLVAGVLGVDSNPDSVAEAIKADPTIAVKLKELELEAHRLDVEAVDKQRQAELDELKARLEDVQSARSRQVEHERATGKTDVNLYLLAWTIVLGFFALVCASIFVEIKDSTGTVFMLMGTMATGFGMVLQYFFGSSKGSVEKTAQIVSMSGSSTK